MRKKKIILVVVLVAVVAAALVYFFVLRGKGAGKAKLPAPVEAYTLQEESVDSITTAVEEGKNEVLISVSTTNPPEDEKKDKDKDKDKEDEEETAETPQATDENQENWSYYYYRIGTDSEEAIKQYKKFLTEDGFAKVTKDADFKQPVSQYAEAYQKDGQQSGRLFVVELEYPLEGNADTGLYSIKVRLEEKPKLKPVTREDTLDYFMGLDYKVLGLEKPIGDYSIVMDMGRTIVDGTECYGICLYEKGGEEQSYFVKKFYLSLAEKKLFEYLNGDIVGMEENKSVSEQTADVSKQSADVAQTAGSAPQ
nr:hypothetical protein [uncultured Anaerotignum sp.]